MRQRGRRRRCVCARPSKLSALASGFVSSRPRLPACMGCGGCGALSRTQVFTDRVARAVATGPAIQLLDCGGTVQPHWLPYLALPALAGAGWRPFGACGCCGCGRPVHRQSAAAGRCAHVQTARRGVDHACCSRASRWAWHGWSAPGQRRDDGRRLAGRAGRCARCRCGGADARPATEPRPWAWNAH